MFESTNQLASLLPNPFFWLCSETYVLRLVFLYFFQFPSKSRSSVDTSMSGLFSPHVPSLLYLDQPNFSPDFDVKLPP